MKHLNSKNLISLTTRCLIAGLALGAIGIACDVPIDTERASPPKGILRGTALYSGPRPCTEGGHVVGNLVLLIIDNRFPGELRAKSIANIGVIPGDKLFASFPRSAADKVCEGGNITASAPWTVSPLDGGSYKIQAFYDYTGHFQPTFSTRNLPERGDVAGGYVDTADAAKNTGNPNYSPIFPNVIVGDPVPSPTGGATTYKVPATGVVVDNIPVTVGSVIPTTRPYFFPEGAENDALAVPVVRMSQAHKLVAPAVSSPSINIDRVERSFPKVVLRWGVAKDEFPFATKRAAWDPQLKRVAGGVFSFQIDPPESGLLTWRSTSQIPEGLLWNMFPQVAFFKLIDAPNSATTQGGPTAPVVVIQGITLWRDSLIATAQPDVPLTPTPVDSISALLRPVALCLDPNKPDQGGTLITPYFRVLSAEDQEVQLFNIEDLKKRSSLIKDAKEACLPTGRYNINLNYPATGQAWTVPNETGSCAETEGVQIPGSPLPTCKDKPREVLRSQGPRAVLEIFAAETADEQAWCAAHPVPPECLPTIATP